MSLKLKALIITIILSAVLLVLGMELGKLTTAAQIDDANSLTQQATEKVLALTQQNQLLEEELQKARLSGVGGNRAAPGEVWPQAGVFYGLVRLKQPTRFNQNLALELETGDKAVGRAVFKLLWQGEAVNLNLTSGKGVNYFNLGFE